MEDVAGSSGRGGGVRVGLGGVVEWTVAASAFDSVSVSVSSASSGMGGSGGLSGEVGRRSMSIGTSTEFACERLGSDSYTDTGEPESASCGVLTTVAPEPRRR